MKKKHVILLAALVILALLFVAGMIVKGQLERNLQSLTQATLAKISVTGIPDGSYDGSYSSFPVSAKVEVLISGGKITDIKLVEHNNGQGQAAEAIPASVVSLQSLSVDTVAGATYSSKVILKAIESALLSAGK